MTTLAGPEASVREKAEMADKLVRFSEQLCRARLPDGRARPAHAVLSAAFIEWAVADCPGLTDFTDLLFATEASLTDYTMAVHDYYGKEAVKGGPRGQVVSVAMQGLTAQGESAVRQAGADAYDTLLAYMAVSGMVAKPKQAPDA